MRLTLLGFALAVAGCASTGSNSSAPGRGSAQAGAAGTAAPLEIPPQAMTMYEQATAVMASGDYLDAELRLKEFLLQYPGYPGAHVNLAIIHVNNDDEAAARAALDAALAINPEYAPALNQQGMLLRKNGKFIEAEAAYLKAVTASPDYALAHYNLGVLNELYLQRLDVALQHFERYRAIVGEDKQVDKWITDLTRRVAASQRTANVAE
ncbi:MAG: tetratricopeptide repeat protein [Woeseiaceae bacterium]